MAIKWCPPRRVTSILYISTRRPYTGTGGLCHPLLLHRMLFLSLVVKPLPSKQGVYDNDPQLVRCIAQEIQTHYRISTRGRRQYLCGDRGSSFPPAAEKGPFILLDQRSIRNTNCGDASGDVPPAGCMSLNRKKRTHALCACAFV